MIVTRLKGGLGNQMFQYAIGRRLSLMHETELKLDLTFLLDRRSRKNFTFRDFDLPIFNVSYEIAQKNEIKRFYNPINRIRRRMFPKSKSNPYFKERSFDFDPMVLSLPDNIYLDGHWLTENYFSSVDEVIRKDFEFRDSLKGIARELSEQISDSNSVCVNVRRGDYISNPAVSKMLGFTGLDYYRKAIEMIRDRQSDVQLFVFSDDIDWCQANLNLAAKAHFVGHQYAGAKFQNYLHLMVLCKHFIIPNSTFGWWAAWLGKHESKTVIAPAKWFNDERFQSEDIYPASWSKI